MIDCVAKGEDIVEDWTGTLKNGAVQITALGEAAAKGTQEKLDETMEQMLEASK